MLPGFGHESVSSAQTPVNHLESAAIQKPADAGTTGETPVAMRDGARALQLALWLDKLESLVRAQYRPSPSLWLAAPQIDAVNGAVEDASARNVIVR
jgi:hypothetical protein